MSVEQIPATYAMPKFWGILSDSDRALYGLMRVTMASPNHKNQRNRRIETFSDSLAIIKGFSMRGDDHDWRRCLVCGVAWLPEGLAINTHQLRLLVFKCKSSINGSLQKMGYASSLGRTETTNAMIRAFPALKNNTSELRQWTVRVHENESRLPSPYSPPCVKPLPTPIINTSNLKSKSQIESDWNFPFIPPVHDLSEEIDFSFSSENQMPTFSEISFSLNFDDVPVLNL